MPSYILKSVSCGLPWAPDVYAVTNDHGFVRWEKNLPSIITDVIFGNQWTNVGLGDPYTQSSFGYMMSNVPVQIPQTISETIELAKVTHNNGDFRKAMQEGKVVVGPYKIDTLTVYSTQGFTPNASNIWWAGRSVNDTAIREFLTSRGIVCVRDPNSSTAWAVKIGNEYHRVTYVTVYCDGGEITDSTLDLDLCNELTKPQGEVFDANQAQEAVAATNSKAVDALSALAELPETIRDIGLALRSITDLLVNFKKHRESLVQNTKRNLDNMQAAFRRKLELLDSMARREKWKVTKHNKAVMNARRALARDTKRANIDLVTSITSLWMTYRYSIMPNVYLIQDLSKAAKRMGTIRVSEHKQQVKAFPVPPLEGWTSSGHCEMKVQSWCQISMQAGENPLDKLMSVASFNPLVTLWELTRLSWMVDWVLDIGSFLSALVSPPNMIDQGVTQAYRWSSIVTYRNTATGGTVMIQREYYNRIVPSTRDFLGIHLQIQMNWKRWFDLFSVLWGQIGPKLRKL